MSDLKSQFEAAVETVRTAEGSYKPSNEEKLSMYALFKQGSEGDVSGKKPGMMDFVGRAKYEAWEKLRGMSQDEAMQKYIDTVNGFQEKLG